MAKPSFTKFKKKVQSVLAQSGNCAESQQDVAAATTVPELVKVWKKYWAGMLDEVPSQFCTALAELYPDYAEQLNSAGIWFNEIVPGGLCIIGNVPESFQSPFDVHSEFIPTKVYVLGRAKVIARGVTQVYGNHADAIIELHDSTHGTVVKGFTFAFDRSTLTTLDRYEQHGRARIYNHIGI